MGQVNRSTHGRAAIVLCGGESRRMGRPKALLPLGDRTFLESVVGTLTGICGSVVIVAAPGQQLPDFEAPVRVVHDGVAHQGPLSGIATGLTAVGDAPEYVYVTGTDTPLLRQAVVAALFDAAQGHDVAMPFDGTRHHPLAAAYRAAFASKRARDLLASNRHRPLFFLEDADAVEVPMESLRSVDPDLSSFRNVNTPAEYRALLEELDLPVPEPFRVPVVDVEFFGVPRLRTGSEHAQIHAENVGELLAELVRQFPALSGAVIESGKLHPAYLLMRGTAERLTDPATPLHADDRLLLLHLDAGG